MATISKCFGALVASGNGSKCDNLKSIIRRNMLITDEDSGKSITWIHKFGAKEYSEQHKKFIFNISEEMDQMLWGKIIMPGFLLDKKFDYSNIETLGSEEWKKELEQWHFSDILEVAMQKGIWNGSVGKS